MRRRREISCAELVELVTDYLEAALPRRQRQRFEAHLGKCDGCSTYLDQIRTTIETTGRLTEDSLDPQARDALLHAFRDWQRARTA